MATTNLSRLKALGRKYSEMDRRYRRALELEAAENTRLRGVIFDQEQAAEFRRFKIHTLEATIRKLEGDIDRVATPPEPASKVGSHLPEYLL